MFSTPHPAAPSKKPTNALERGAEERFSNGNEQQFVGLRAKSNARPGSEVIRIVKTVTAGRERSGGTVWQCTLYPRQPSWPATASNSSHSCSRSTPKLQELRSPCCGHGGLPEWSSVWLRPDSADACFPLVPAVWPWASGFIPHRSVGLSQMG